MKRSALGNTEIDLTIPYWTEGKSQYGLRRSETFLYADIDLSNELVNIAKTHEEVEDEYNKMDCNYIQLQAIKQYSADSYKMWAAGVVIGDMISEGHFSNRFDTLAERNDKLVALVSEMYDRVENFSEVTRTSINMDFMLLYKENVLDLNYYQNPDGTITDDAPSLAGLSGTGDDMFSMKAKEGGAHMLYVLTDVNPAEKDGNVRAILRKKLSSQNYIDWFDGSGTNLSRASILANGKAGIIQATGKTPEDALSDLKDRKEKGLGEPVTIILAILAAITAIIYLIVEILKNKNLKKAEELQNTAPDQSTLEYNAPDPLDWNGDGVVDELDDFNNDGIVDANDGLLPNKQTPLSTIVLWGGIGLAAVVGLVALLGGKRNRQQQP